MLNQILKSDISKELWDWSKYETNETKVDKLIALVNKYELLKREQIRKESD